MYYFLLPISITLKATVLKHPCLKAVIWIWESNWQKGSVTVSELFDNICGTPMFWTEMYVEVARRRKIHGWRDHIPILQSTISASSVITKLPLATDIEGLHQHHHSPSWLKFLYRKSWKSGEDITQKNPSSVLMSGDQWHSQQIRSKLQGPAIYVMHGNG